MNNTNNPNSEATVIDGKKLSIGNKPDGGTYNSMGFDQEDNPVWKIAPAATDGCIYLQSATATMPCSATV